MTTIGKRLTHKTTANCEQSIYFEIYFFSYTSHSLL